MKYVVSPDGAESNNGSAGSPWPLSKGISMLSPGDVLYLRGGSYVGRVFLGGMKATPSNPIVIQSFPGERATIDGTISDFREVPNGDWVPRQNDEYISATSYPHGDNDAAQGSFLYQGSYSISGWSPTRRSRTCRRKTSSSGR